MTAFSGDIQIAASSPFSTSAVAEHVLGSRAKTPDGKIFRYVQAGATALVPGTLVQAPAEVTNHQNLAPAAAAVGTPSVTVTLGATAATANQYAGGTMIVTVTPGQGYSYRIASHPAASSSATLVLTLEDPILVALTTSSRVDLAPSPFGGVIINPATASASVIGAAVYPIAATQYGWIQSGGVAALLNDSAATIAVGTGVVASNATAGAIEAITGAQAPVGISMTSIATTEYGTIRLLLDS